MDLFQIFFRAPPARRCPMSNETPADSRKNAGNTRGKPFERGNPGKPKGARHRVTVAAETLLEGEAEAITRKAIELAKSGDGPALRLCMDRIYPARKDRPVRFRLPPLEKVGDAVAANAALVGAVAQRLQRSGTSLNTRPDLGSNVILRVII